MGNGQWELKKNVFLFLIITMIVLVASYPYPFFKGACLLNRYFSNNKNQKGKG